MIESSMEGDSHTETLKPEVSLEKLLAQLPTEEKSVYLVGQHGFSEPIAQMVGQEIVSKKQKINEDVKSEIFPSGFDYSDSLGQITENKDLQKIDNEELNKMLNNIRNGEFGDREVANMVEIAEKHSDQIVFNFHETPEPWNIDFQKIDILLPPRLTPRAAQDFKFFIKNLNQKLKDTGIGIYIEAKTLNDSHDYKAFRKFKQLPQNMLVVEISTPTDLYQKIDDNISVLGNSTLKTDIESQAKIQDWTTKYVESLSLLLPVINSEYSKYLDPKFDIKKYVLDW